MNDYEKLLCCGILIDSIYKYQTSCRNKLLELKQKLHDLNLMGLTDSSEKTEILTEITTVESTMADINKTLTDVISKKANLLNSIQGNTGLGITNALDFTDLKY